MVGVFALIWLLMLRPQRKKMQTQQNLLRNLEVGDEVLTASGIYGRIDSFDQDSLFLEVSDNNMIKITRDSIAQRISFDEPSNGAAEAAASEEVHEDTPEKEDS